MSPAAVATGTGSVALRTALVWHDEVMEDVVVEEPRNITLGSSGKSTFVVPDIGLPQNFAIVRPGNRGYLLTLGEHMRGQVSIDGQVRDVADLVRSNDGGFYATSISGRDWGVIELDESGIHKLFFQFVPLEVKPSFAAPVTSLLAFLLSIYFIMIILAGGGEGNIPVIVGMAGLATLGAGYFILHLEPEGKASIAFSFILHAALLWGTYELFDPESNLVWPGRRDLTGEYLLARIEKPPEPPKPEPTVGAVTDKPASGGTAAPKTKEKPATVVSKGAEGASGGEGKLERARDPDARVDEKRGAAPKVELMSSANTRVYDNIVNRPMESPVNRFNTIKGPQRTMGDLGFGAGTGTGVGGEQGGTGTKHGGKGNGPGANGSTEGDYASKQGDIDTGKNRPGSGNCKKPPCTGNGTGGPKEVQMALSTPGGDLAGYTEDEIKRGIKAREGIFRKCYQKELDRTPGLSGKLVIQFKIGPDGSVLSASKAGSSTLSNDAVEDCVTNNMSKLRFAPKGVTANVKFPFLYSSGGG